MDRMETRTHGRALPGLYERLRCGLGIEREVTAEMEVPRQ